MESPAKAKTINKYLGREYTVHACMGHIRDLPPKKFGIDLKKNFKPTYEIIKSKQKVIDQLTKYAAKSPAIYLAPDPDREGEAIAWHLSEALHFPEDRTFRVTFNEITKSAIQQAFASPGKISWDKVDAQQARRLLDRIVGYQLSPLLWKKVTKGLSAGRVQSVAVRLIVEREREIRAFQSVEYWTIAAHLSKDGTTFSAELKRKNGQPISLPDQAAAKTATAQLEKARYLVKALEQKEKTEPAHPPFITSTLQQQASIQLGYSAKKTMMVAQQLYEGVELGDEGAVGLITYMRTDSVRISDGALQEVRAFIEKKYGAPYLPSKPNSYASRKGTQGAHEAIRPTSLQYPPDQVANFLTRDQWRLYRLIWTRFVASQMNPARFAIADAQIETDNGYLFRTQGRRLLFDGHLKVLKTRTQEEEKPLPPLAAGDKLQLEKLDVGQHFTQPPPRYTEATLVKNLEKKGIGRPSTYAPIISTIVDRGYVRLEERKFFASELGILVTDLLLSHFPLLMDVAFTSHLETALDKIEAGQLKCNEVLKEFYDVFAKDLAKAHEEMKNVKTEPEKSGVPCPKCAKEMIYKWNRFGKFLGCSGYPECKSTKSLDREGKVVELPEVNASCEKCGKPMVAKLGRRGKFAACSDYPNCKNTKSLTDDGKVVEAESLHASCEKCGKPMVVKFGRRGKFAACSGYPECKNAKPLGSDGQVLVLPPVNESCEKCGKPMAIKKGRRGLFIACTGYPQCRNAKPCKTEEPETAGEAGTPAAAAPAPES